MLSAAVPGAEERARWSWYVSAQEVINGAAAFLLCFLPSHCFAPHRKLQSTLAEESSCGAPSAGEGNFWDSLKQRYNSPSVFLAINSSLDAVIRF